jgi:Fur family transcriptional regulator, ferric uptake regulator
LTSFAPHVILTIEKHYQLDTQMSISPKTIESALRHHGYKVTPQRRIVIEAIMVSHEHQTPAAIHERVKTAHPGIGLVTIYRTLEILAELGLICETHAGHSCRSYLMRESSGHHHHLICSDCGKVEIFTDCDLDELENKLMEKSGFKIDSHLLEFLGQCRQCAVLGNRAGKKDDNIKLVSNITV